MVKKNLHNPDWQEHLDQLGHDRSADQHFIREFKASPKQRLLDDEYDYFSSPMLEQVFAESGEGQLALDVYQTDDELVIKSTMAGVSPQDLEISLDNDVLTIRGERKKEAEVSDADYFYQECYWGTFSRSMVLPTAVNPDKVKAVIKNGVLTVTLQKVKSSKSVRINVKEIE